MSMLRYVALVLAATFSASAPLSAATSVSATATRPIAKGIRATVIFPQTHGPTGYNELFDDQGGCLQVLGTFWMGSDTSHAMTVKGTGNGDTPILINPSGPGGGATATQCNVVLSSAIPSGYYHYSITTIQSALGFKMGPKTYTPSTGQVFVPGNNYGLLTVHYAVVQ
jgi:hypothetical protein